MVKILINEIITQNINQWNYHPPCASRFLLNLRILSVYFLITKLLSFLLSIINCVNLLTVIFLETKKNMYIIIQTCNQIWLQLYYYACLHRVRGIYAFVSIINWYFKIRLHVNRNCLSNVQMWNLNCLQTLRRWRLISEILHSIISLFRNYL